MMKRILFIFLIFSALGVKAQQDPQFTQNFATQLYNNPAYAGMNQAICATGVFRQQWMGFEGAPRDILFSVHSPIKIFKGIPQLNPAVGFTFVNDVIGVQSLNGFKLSLANRFVLPNIGNLSFGIGLGAMGVSFDGSEFVTPDGNAANGGGTNSTIVDPNLNPNANSQQYGFDMDLGLYFKSEDKKIFGGVSLQHLNQSALEGEVFNSGVVQSTKYQSQSHMYFIGGYNYEWNADWTFTPTVFIKTEFRTMQFDLNVRALYKEMVWGGVSYRFQDAIAPMVGYQTSALGPGIAKIGMSYDITTQKLSNYSSGTFEVFVNYCFNISIPPKVTIHKNPFWL
ncbi:type IX secretion system membrane protein PorP/SprF [bacterium SCSIO 12741]|nr:type IX secretion system membrane protein PorP/SprF [bacterium SCSIO 12741]